MKIIEALKNLKIIKKKVERNNKEIERLASKVNSTKSYYPTDDEQKQEIRSLVQSNLDLIKEYHRLKKNVEHTNLISNIEINGKNYSISDLLIGKRDTLDLETKTFQSLNDTEGEKQRRYAPAIDNKTPVVERLYEERWKMDNLRRIQDVKDNIDAKLEIFNATTDLIEQY